MNVLAAAEPYKFTATHNTPKPLLEDYGTLCQAEQSARDAITRKLARIIKHKSYSNTNITTEAHLYIFTERELLELASQLKQN
jgi:hypothetical protein